MSKLRLASQAKEDAEEAKQERLLERSGLLPRIDEAIAEGDTSTGIYLEEWSDYDIDVLSAFLKEKEYSVHYDEEDSYLHVSWSYA